MSLPRILFVLGLIILICSVKCTKGRYTKNLDVTTGPRDEKNVLSHLISKLHGGHLVEPDSNEDTNTTTNGHISIVGTLENINPAQLNKKTTSPERKETEKPEELSWLESLFESIKSFFG